MLESISFNKKYFGQFLDLSQEACVGSDDKNTTVEVCKDIDEAHDASITTTLKDDRNAHAKMAPLLLVEALQYIGTHDLNVSVNAITEAVKNPDGNSQC